MNDSCNIALLSDLDDEYTALLLPGIEDFMREHPSWFLHPQRGNAGIRFAKSYWHGVIANIQSDEMARVVKRLRVPVVDISCERRIPAVPWVQTDPMAVGRLAAEHLLERGLKHFGYCGDDRFAFSRQRGEQFARSLGDAGYPCAMYQPLKTPSVENAERVIERLAKWLGALPKPIGIMASFDFRAQQILLACQRQGLAVPEQVAVLTVYAGEHIIKITHPPLTSINLNMRRMGYEAAALLDRMLAGAKVPPGEAHLIAPLGVMARQSTDVLAIEDHHVAAALRYITHHACEGLKVKDLCSVVPLSRRLLEYRFHKLIGRTPHEEILRVQLNQTQTLLTETDLSLDQIAERAGFVHAGYLSRVFRQKFGLPPGQYRTQHKRLGEI